MSLYTQFKSSPKYETEGVWLDYGESGRILIARAGGSNRAYLKAIENLSRKYRRQIQLEILPEEVAKKIFREIFADTIVLKWENVKDEAGKPLEFTKANAVKLFTDLPELFRDVQEQANNFSLFREQVDEADAGN